jgi:hypothetical protein
MKIIGKVANRKEASLLCEKIFCIEQARPRIRELLDLECDPKHSPVAQKTIRHLMNGELIVVDSKKKEVEARHKEEVSKFNDLNLIPADPPNLKIYLYNHKTEKEIGPLSLLKLYYQLQILNLEIISFWHTGIEDFVNLAELKERLIG